ncbi:hypothetical protein QTO34_012980 [Cnephaeus nilssonii]|uniref:Uncharacterized protein n=1 Tax=Cnephaeus nilssonii TaxID=3371016 RepID=A0AA40LDG0_CNENI|nr:hypothetical protein QTO34_012980 [Eptesicus nilssonii]
MADWQPLLFARPDWRQEKFQACEVCHSGSRLCGFQPCCLYEKRSVTLKDTCGPGGIQQGLLEVEVQRSSVVGVCREDVKRTGWFRESPEKGFWAVGWFETDIVPAL